MALLVLYVRRQRKARSQKPALHLFDKSLRGRGKELLQGLQQGCNESSVVGIGGMSVVYKVVLSNGRAIAVKRMSLALSAKEAKRIFLRESRVLGQVRHRNVLKLLGACSRPQSLLSCIFDFMPNKSLDDHLHPPQESNAALWKPLSWPERYKIAVGVAQGLSYLHNDTGFGQVLHLDLKPSNILLDHEFEPRISDFGISRVLMEGNESTTSHFKGSIGYVAPEFAYSHKVTDRADVYSFGIILLELVTAKRPNLSDCFDEQHPDLRAWVASSFTSSTVDIDQNNNSPWDRVSLLVDKALQQRDPNNDNYNRTTEFIIMHRQVLDFLQVGLLCTHQSPSSRPGMKEVLLMLLDIGFLRTTRNKHPDSQSLCMQIPNLQPASEVKASSSDFESSLLIP